MEFFERAKTVRLRSHHDKYLVAEEDGEHVCQDRDGCCPDARWMVERVDDAPHALRLRSFHGRYLTATDEPFRLGVHGKKVRLTLPSRLDSSLEWEPIREGTQVKLKTRYGNYLRGNGRLPPYRGSVTHDVPHRSSTQDWILWDVEVVEILLQPSPAPSSPRLSNIQSSSSFHTPLHKVDDRIIYYTVADDDGNVNDSVEWPHLIFNGTSAPELTEILKEETELDDIIVCTRNPVNKQLIPLLLHLPPNNTTMRLVVVDANSKAATSFQHLKD